MIRLRHVAAINPATPQFDVLPDDAEIPFLPLEAVWPGERFDASRRRSKADVSTGYTRFVEGDILVPKITPTFQADRTVLATRIGDGVGAATTEVHVVRVSRAAEPRYVRYLLSSKHFLDEGEAAMIGVAGQKRVPDDHLRDLRVPIRDRLQQQRIADYLDAETARIDALIANKERILELIEQRFNSMRVEHILEGLDPVSGRWMEVSEDVRTLPLGVLITLHRGFDLPVEARTDGETPVVASGGVVGWHGQKACDGPGVVTGRYGTIGEVFYVDGPYWPLNTALFVSNFRGNYPRWVYHLLAALPLDVDSAKSAVTGINRNIVGQLRVPRVSGPEQVLIAARLDREREQLDRLHAPLGRQIDLLREHRQALITAAVTGELKIPGVAA